jgi:hypothetical protein
MFGLKSCVKSGVVGLLAVVLASGAGIAGAQTQRRTRRESNANRQARIARATADTYNHRYEVGGGGGYMRFRSGEYLQKNNEVTFWMNGTYFLNPKLGVIAEVRGAYGNAKIGNTTFNLKNPQISEYPIMGGVTYRLYAKEKTAISVFGEAGAAIGKFDGGSKTIPSKDLGLWQSTTKPVFSIGANFDYNFYPNLAFRVTPTYTATFYKLDPLDTAPQPHGAIQNNLGLNIGLVYRFGRIK